MVTLSSCKNLYIYGLHKKWLLCVTSITNNALRCLTDVWNSTDNLVVATLCACNLKFEVGETLPSFHVFLPTIESFVKGIPDAISAICLHYMYLFQGGTPLECGNQLLWAEHSVLQLSSMRLWGCLISPGSFGHRVHQLSLLLPFQPHLFSSMPIYCNYLTFNLTSQVPSNSDPLLKWTWETLYNNKLERKSGFQCCQLQ